MKIPFNRPYITGLEKTYVNEVLESRKLSGNRDFTGKCHAHFEKQAGFKKVLLTSSCTDALEMSALLLDIQPGDEVIMPSYTFVSTANSFALRGAVPVFADSSTLNPNIDPSEIERLVNPKTKAILIVHYAGIACDMDRIMKIADDNNLPVVEDAAQSIGSFYKGRPLGTIGTFGTFSFHETKNVTSGEGGLLIINDPAYNQKAEYAWEKGTNRLEFHRKETDKYNWVSLGSSYLMSELNAALLYAQLEQFEQIQTLRKEAWNLYYQDLKHLQEESLIQLPNIPDYATNNAHIFYLVCRTGNERDRLLKHLQNNGILAVFHYLALHESPYFKPNYKGTDLKNAIMYTSNLVRLPLFAGLTKNEIEQVTKSIREFFHNERIYDQEKTDSKKPSAG